MQVNAKVSLEQGTSLRVFTDPAMSEIVLAQIKGMKHVFGASYETYTKNKIDYAGTIRSIHETVDRYHRSLPVQIIDGRPVLREDQRVKPQYIATAKEIYTTYIRCYEGNRPANAAQIGAERRIKINGQETDCPQLLLNVDYLRQMLGYKTNDSMNSHIAWLEKAQVLWHTEFLTGSRRLKGKYSSVFTLNAGCIQHL